VLLLINSNILKDWTISREVFILVISIAAVKIFTPQRLHANIQMLYKLYSLYWMKI